MHLGDTQPPGNGTLGKIRVELQVDDCFLPGVHVPQGCLKVQFVHQSCQFGVFIPQVVQDGRRVFAVVSFILGIQRQGLTVPLRLKRLEYFLVGKAGVLGYIGHCRGSAQALGKSDHRSVYRQFLLL